MCRHEAYCQHKNWTANDDLTRTTRNWVAGLSLFKPRRYEQSTYAPPVFSVTQPPAPSMDMSSNINTTQCQPGERREAVVHRPLASRDLGPYLLYAGAGSAATWGALTVFGVTAQWAGGVALSIFAAGFMVPAAVMLFRDGPNPVVKTETIERVETQPESTPAPQATIPIEHNRDREGRMYRQSGGIPCPAEGEQALANWFYAVCRSDGDGFSIRIGKQYGISPAEVGQVQMWFLSQYPPQATRGRNNWIRPNDEGFDTMWGVVERNIPGAYLPQ